MRGAANGPGSAGSASSLRISRRGVLGALAGGVGCIAAPLPSFAQGRAVYDVDGQLPLKVIEMEYRRGPGGRALLARVYRPAGGGRWPVIIDLHGGGWNAKDRTAEEPFNRALASGGAVVIAIDTTRAPEAPYPASVIDAHFGIRWAKANAGRWGGDTTLPVGIFASSSGGHLAELLMLRPDDPRYAAAPMPGADALTAAVDYLILRSPVSDTVARYENAVAMKNEAMILNHTNFFVPFDTLHEANPYEIILSGQHAKLKPMLILQGALDDNVRPAAQARFVEAYRRAGGSIDYEVFAGAEHEWVAKPGPQTSAAYRKARLFVARQIAARPGQAR